MSDLQERQFRLYKEIQKDFRKDVDPELLMDYLAGCLTEDDIDRVRTKLLNKGRSIAVEELLDRLRRRPNWENHLLEALQHPELKLNHLFKLFIEKSTELQIKITLHNKCKDGHNCAPREQISPDISSQVVVAEKEHEKEPKSELGKVLKEFKARVDPEDFLQYLENLKEKDEDAIKSKQEKEGRAEAAEELISRLLLYRHWKDDLEKALKMPGSGLEDLGRTLCEIDVEVSELEKAVMSVNHQNLGPEEINQKRISILYEFVGRRMLDVRSEEDLHALKALTDNVDAYLKKLGQGSLILTIAINSLETLESIQKMYHGGVLLDAIRKDILGQDRLYQVRHSMEKFELIAEKYGMDKSILDFSADSFDVEVQINPVEIQYSLLNLRAYRDSSIPATAIQSLRDFKRKMNPKVQFATNKHGLHLTPTVCKLLEDPFVQAHCEELVSILEGSDLEDSVVITTWLWKKLESFVADHKFKAELCKLGIELGEARKNDTGEKEEQCFFGIEKVQDTVRPQIAATGKVDSCVLSTEIWEQILKEGIIIFSKAHQKYCFSSPVLEQFLIYNSGILSAVQLCGYYPLFKLVENPREFTTILINSDFTNKPSGKMEYFLLHYVIMKCTDQSHRLDALKTLIPAEKLYTVEVLKDTQEIQANVLHILIQEQMIDKFELSMASSSMTQWDVSTGVVTKSIMIPDIEILVHLSSVLSTLGTLNIHVTVDENGQRLAETKLKVSQGEPVFGRGYLSLKFSGASLNPAKDVKILCEGLQKTANLFELDLSRTTLTPEAYREILQACRFSPLISLVLNDTRLMDLRKPEPLGLYFLPQLKRLEMERCKLGNAGLQAMSSDFKVAAKLTEINVADNNITGSGIMEISALLMDKENLRIVRVHENTIGYEGAMSLSILFKNLPLLEVVNLCSCKEISEKGFELIIKSLNGKNLKKMNIRECGFSQSVAEKYFNLLKNMPHFQHLDYGCNAIGVLEGTITEGLSNISASFLEMMKCNQHSWNHLSLWKCQLGSTTIFTSSDRLLHLSTLTDICLQENDLDDTAGSCIGECMVKSWHSLRYLNLRQNNIGDSGARKILDGIHTNLKLEKIYIDRNSIQSIELAKDMILFFFEKAPPSLKEMDISYNDVTEYRRPQLEIKRYLAGMKGAEIKESDGHTDISYKSRTMKL
ncbi:uncharacterized protein LOC133202180 [Saccostrea echinata]|uniref:uncharacterized protein LOC133202180 n=1 Tax=Saccostrea echinata TaxID=191078 RepID=UPI002A7EF0D9|nr:uncharacterized protein LOC133202180 [Saccostrea echinata]